jgi:hypothetical protein
LNPKKSIFVVEQGKLLGFIVSSEGMIIDPKRTQVIVKLPPPTSKKSMRPLESQAFNAINQAIIDALSLMSLDFSQDFTLYTFASDRSYAAVLTQKNAENNEVPIAFMSSAFKGTELNLPAVDRQAYTIFKEIKHFRSYLLKSRTKVIVPYLVVRNLLVHKELGEKRDNWVTSL